MVRDPHSPPQWPPQTSAMNIRPGREANIPADTAPTAPACSSCRVARAAAMASSCARSTTRRHGCVVEPAHTPGSRGLVRPLWALLVRPRSAAPETPRWTVRRPGRAVAEACETQRQRARTRSSPSETSSRNRSSRLGCSAVTDSATTPTATNGSRHSPDPPGRAPSTPRPDPAGGRQSRPAPPGSPAPTSRNRTWVLRSSNRSWPPDGGRAAAGRAATPAPQSA